MKVTLDKLFIIDDDSKMKGSASVIIDDCFKITGIKIIDGTNGLFLSMATKYIIAINKIKINDNITWYTLLVFFISGYNISSAIENKKPYIREKTNSFIWIFKLII